jgi:formylglycine-generating enzyme required for sulfatase activity/serine/threonine protein kinase
MTNEMAEVIFAAWAARVEAGEALEFYDLLREQAEHTAELRKLHEDWKLFAPLLGKVVPGLIGSDGDIVVKPLSSGGDDEPAMPTDELVDRLGIKAPNSGRYRFRAVIGRGGGGVVLKVWDTKLCRPLAMKVVLGRGEGGRPSGDKPKVDSQRLTRFVDEARIASQLNHPGIVPVHELGADETGRAFFTMKLVKGEDLSVVFEHVKTGKDDWNQTRALNVLQRVCEAMAFAHDKGVVHRDLKPANIMVGKFGEVYVMDWGLARVMGEEDHVDLGVKPPSSANASVLDSLRVAEPYGSPLLTRRSQALGTPAYMSPEQARGDVEAIGVRSDVYALGAMIYELVAGRMPYVDPAVPVGPATIMDLVKLGPPEPLTKLAPRAPAELIAIAEKAMAREPAKRYANTQDLEADLRAFLVGRVVKAYETGTWAETRKWVRRNRALAGALAGIVLVAVVGGAAFAVQAREATRQARLASANAGAAAERANELLSLSAIKELTLLEAEADRLWPATPDKVPQFEQWLAKAAVLIDGRATDEGPHKSIHPSLKDHRAALAKLLMRANPPTDDQDEAVRREAKQEAPVSERGAFEFDNPQDDWWCEQLVELIDSLKDLRDAQAGGLCTSAVWEVHGWGMLKRLDFARTVEERSLSGAEPKRRWEEAIAAIAKSPKYGRLQLRPQLGLLPIGEDPDSHLWEFAHLQTGEAAQRDGDGRLVLNEEMGLVFVLLPGGTFWMGGQRTDPNGHNYDPQASEDESPVRDVTLDAYFVSKFEMTQGQWLRFVGRNGSHNGPGSSFGDEAYNLLHPVEQASWNECMNVLKRLDLDLPTEAQWEYCARAGTTSAWWTGNEKDTLQGAANLADRYCHAQGGPSMSQYEDTLEDGRVLHAPVGSYRPNGFGLHDVIGNVCEWCRDGYGGYDLPAREGDGERRTSVVTDRVIRGGSFIDLPSGARSSRRATYTVGGSTFTVGLRPIRALVP